MATIEEVLENRLSLQVTSVNERIYPVEAPQNAARPFITYQLITETVESGISDDHGMTHPLIQVDVWGDSYASVRTTQGEVRAALKRWSDPATNPPVLDCFLRRNTDHGREDDQPQPRYYHRSSDWEIWYRE